APNKNHVAALRHAVWATPRYRKTLGVVSTQGNRHGDQRDDARHDRTARRPAAAGRGLGPWRTLVLSYAKVRALTRVATPETEERLWRVGRPGTAAHIEGIVQVWRRGDRKAERPDAARQHKRRGLSLYTDGDGAVVLRGRLTPEVGALVQ